MQLLILSDGELPAPLRSQILAAVRREWPEDFDDEHRDRPWIQRAQFHPTHVVLVEDDRLIAYAGVVSKDLAHAGETYRTYGLSGVVAAPALRRQGHGRRVVEAATALIRASDADIGLLRCPPSLTAFYAACGWEPIAGATLFGGPADASALERTQAVMMGFFSEKGRAGRESFAAEPIYFDDDLW
ncbi:MAG TPA: GNAT family N-acetyltransferase [Thermomicrobiales bacterium]|nr:GNAT family N-acetyltransferase [Thermomicrobiales bacterium]